MLKGKKNHSLKTKQASELYLDMTQILELSDKEFKITMSNMVRALSGKLDNMQEEMGNVSEKKETLKKNQNSARNKKNNDILYVR